MPEAKRQYNDDVPDDVTARLRDFCLALPEAYEKPGWVGTCWMIRKHTFARVLGVELDDQPSFVTLTFRAAGDELDALANAGHPFYVLPWGTGAMGMVIDDDVDWEEVRELVTESYCVLAPKKLTALVDRPDPEPSD